MSNPWARWLAGNSPQRLPLSRKAGWDAYVNRGPRQPLTRLTRAQLAALSGDELSDYNEARAVWNANPPTVKTAQVQAAYEIIDQVMASGRRDGDQLRGSAVIDAAPGLGKTTIAKQYARDFHRRQYRREGPLTTEGHQRLPVAFIPLSASITLKGLNQKLLRFYGHPGAERASSTRLEALAVDCIVSCQTQLIVIDDLHFIDFGHRNGMDISNHLKSLANEMPATFIYVGVQLSQRRFFNEGMSGEQAAYAQTSRRATRCPVAPFSISTPGGYHGWIRLLQAFEGHLNLVDAHPGMLTDHAEALHRRTQGHIASLTNLIDRAAYLAIATGAETITGQLIAKTTIDNAAQQLAGQAG